MWKDILKEVSIRDREMYMDAIDLIGKVEDNVSLDDIQEFVEELELELLKSETVTWEQEQKIAETMEKMDEVFSQIEKMQESLQKIQEHAEKNNLKNALFLRIQIENILDFFDFNEVEEIIISFPDPRPKKRDIKKRLTNLKFLDFYNYFQSLYKG